MTGQLIDRWITFLSKILSDFVKTRRSLPIYREENIKVDLHVFGDASKTGTAAVLYVYAVINQERRSEVVSTRSFLIDLCE